MVELKTVAINTTILLMFLNAGPALLVDSGTAEDLGISPSVSGDKSVNEANDALTGDPDDSNENGIEASGGFGDTLFGLYNSVTGPVRSVLGLVTAGPAMLSSAGVPGWIVGFIFIPQYLIVGGTVIYVLAGRLL